MSGKVAGGSKQAPVHQVATGNTPKPQPKAAEPTPQLSERALRRTGKASGFTSTAKAFSPSSGPQLSSDAPAVRAGSAAAMQQLRSAGGKLATSEAEINAAEGSVANNPANLEEWSSKSLQSRPQDFLANVVQLDGSLGSKHDRTACGPTSLLIGMIAGRPAALQELAGKIIDKQGNLTPAGQHFALKIAARAQAEGKKEAEAVSALESFIDTVGRLKEGKAFTPADVTDFAGYIQLLEPGSGSASDDLRAAAQSIEDMGVKLPPMELQLFGAPEGKAKDDLGHWRVVSRGEQYNPWPNEKGQSTRLSAAKGLADGMKDGAGWVLRERVKLGSK